MQYFLGVDGGQSSTTALIGDASGRVLGMGRGGPCNHVSGDEARVRFTTAVGGCVAQAREAAGLATDVEFAAACFGFSGSPADKDALVASLQQRLLQSTLTGDQKDALRQFLDAKITLTDSDIMTVIRLVMSTPEYQVT